MEIKTTREIWFNCQNDKVFPPLNYDNKWVRVDDEIIGWRLIKSMLKVTTNLNQLKEVIKNIDNQINELSQSNPNDDNSGKLGNDKLSNPVNVKDTGRDTLKCPLCNKNKPRIYAYMDDGGYTKICMSCSKQKSKGVDYYV